MTLNNSQVKFILQHVQAIAIDINNGNVIVFTDQVFGQRAANLSCTQNDYLHQLRPVISITV